MPHAIQNLHMYVHMCIYIVLYEYKYFQWKKLACRIIYNVLGDAQ